MKQQKLIRLSEDVLKDIQLNDCMDNFSDWVERAYRNEFMTMKNKKEQLEKIKAEAERLEKEVALMKEEDEKRMSKSDRVFCNICGESAIDEVKINGLITCKQCYLTRSEELRKKRRDGQ